MEASIMGAVGLLQEAQARANYHDDWERNFERLQERADIEEFKQALRNTVLRIVSLFNIPALRATHA
jgi:hypothetical protein